MRRFLLLRSVGLIVVMVTMIAVVFLLRQVIPSDPARAAVGPNAPASTVEAKRKELGLDKPLVQQFGIYLTDLARGDLGMSVRTHRPVIKDIGDALPPSVELVTTTVLVAIPLAVAMALLQTLVPRVAPLRLLLLGGASAPIFLAGLLLLYFLWFRLNLLPGGGQTQAGDAPSGPTGLLVVDSLLSARLDVTGDAILHLVLPTLTLAVPMAVAIGRTLQASLLGVLRHDYIRAARARGLTEPQVMVHHALRNASTAALAMTGLQFGILLANLLLVERIFAWPGLGLYAVQALAGDDLNAVLGVALLFGVIYIIVNTLVDLAQAVMDPRVVLE